MSRLPYLLQACFSLESQGLVRLYSEGQEKGALTACTAGGGELVLSIGVGVTAQKCLPVFSAASGLTCTRPSLLAWPPRRLFAVWF